MYTWITDFLKKPLVLLVLLIIILIAIYGTIHVGQSLLTTLGFNTKENVTEKLIKTENELDKLLEIAKKNEEAKIISDAVTEVEVNKTIKDLEEQVEIIKEESRILEEVLILEREEKSKLETEVKVVEKIIVKTNTVKPTLTKSQEVLLNNIILRANNMEGSK